jgi:hypothetical protein
MTNDMMRVSSHISTPKKYEVETKNLFLPFARQNHARPPPRVSASPIPCPLLALPSGPTIPLRSIMICSASYPATLPRHCRSASCPSPLQRRCRSVFPGSVSLMRLQHPSLPPSASTSLREEVARGLSSAWPRWWLVSLRWPQCCGGRRSHCGTHDVIHLAVTRSREEGPICRALLLYRPALQLPTRPNPHACKVRFWISMVHAQVSDAPSLRLLAFPSS